MNPEYPRGTMRDLLGSDAVTPPTREALEERLARPLSTSPQFLSPLELITLRAVCNRLVPQQERPIAIDLAGILDERIAQGNGNGWRYDALPPDGEALRRGLRGLDQCAQARYGGEFAALDEKQQDAVLRAVQEGEAEGEIWQTMPPVLWFEEFFAEMVENFYGHPETQQSIGYVGFADAPGWTKIGLNEREDREPEEEKRSGGEEEKEDKRGFNDSFALTSSSSPPLLFSSSGTGSEATMRHHALNDEVDALVIGTGAGGSPLLARLAQAGLRVVALEAGPMWNPARDFATDEQAQEKLFWTDERLSAGKDPLHFGANNSGIGVGGSTLHYTAYTPRVQPDDLRLHSEFGVGCDWPLSYDDLEPYFDELELFLGVSGPSPYPWGPARKTSYPLVPLPLNGAAQLMARGCKSLGIVTSPAANAALSAPYFQAGVGWRAACTNRGFCQAGCSTGAKASMDATFLPLAVANGAEIRPGCFVTRIETDSSGRVTGVVYTREGLEERQKCKHLFLCAGAIETPRLLMLNGLALGSGQVGKNFMAHTGMQLWGQFDEMVRPFKGIPGGLISEDTHRPKDADFAGGYLLQSIGVMPVTYASQFARVQGSRGEWGEALRDHMANYNHTAGINILGDCLPYENNFMELSDELDARGLPKPRVHFSAGDNEKKMHAHALKIMCAIFEAAGARETWSFSRFAHTIGTCRMGDDDQSAVVNADGRSFEVPNLSICDNSVFPSALGVNPALTIMALSLRTADRFLTTNKRGSTPREREA
jgi:choline dehydrogenase-like flavoprotein